MTTKKVTNEFEGFDDAGMEMPQEDKWVYPPIGYNSSEGLFYADDETPKEITLVPFALRQCKEVEDINGVIHRYPLRHRRADMIEGDITYRLQVVCMYNEKLHVFGARSFTAGTAWVNPRGGNYHNDEFQVGLWYALTDWIKLVKSQKSVQTAPYCWEVELNVSKKAIKVGKGRNTSNIYPIAYEESFNFVGKETAYKYRDLYNEEELDLWVEEWKKKAQEQAPDGDPGSIGATEDSLDDIPGFGLE